VQSDEEANHPCSLGEGEYQYSPSVSKHCEGRDEPFIDAVTERATDCHSDNLHNRQGCTYEAGLL